MIDALREAIAQQRRRSTWRSAASSIGCAFGAVVFATNFCAMGSLSDIHNFGDWRRFRAWILAGGDGACRRPAAAGRRRRRPRQVDVPRGTGLNWAGPHPGRPDVRLRHGVHRRLPEPQPGARRRRRSALAAHPRRARPVRLHGTSAASLRRLRAALEQATSVPPCAPTQSLGDLVSSAAGLAPSTGNLLAMALLGAAALAFASRTRAFAPRPCTCSRGSRSA